MTFNRRRQGEASKLKMIDIQTKCSTGVKETALQETLTKFEKALCKTLTRVEIVGKGGNTVPVILTFEMKTQIDLLVAKRSEAGVSDSNPYVFARACYGSESHLRGADCLRKLSIECGAENPDRLTSTRLRKHIATVSQILHLNENELEVLAKFMGHDIRMHRQYYRLPDETMQVAKMTKFLLNLERPDSLAEMTGKSWNDIEVSVDEEVEEDSEGNEDTEDTDDTEDNEDNEGQAVHHDIALPVEREQDPEPSFVEKRAARTPWTNEEKDAILKHFSAFILRAKLPGKDEIERVRKTEKALKSRSWRNVKDFIRNQIVSKARKSSKT